MVPTCTDLWAQEQHHKCRQFLKTNDMFTRKIAEQGNSNKINCENLAIDLKYTINSLSYKIYEFLFFLLFIIFLLLFISHRS